MAIGTTLNFERIDELVALVEPATRGSVGGIVFIAGPPGSGKTRLCRDLAKRCRELKSPSVVLEGEVVDGHYEPSATPKGPSGSDRLQVVSATLAVAGTAGVPLASLLGQLLNLGRTGAALKSKTPERPLAELTASLCDTAAKAPLVCVVDRADALVGTWWSPLLDQLAVRISHGLPLFMFLAVDGGPAPGQHTEDEPDALNAARRLINGRRRSSCAATWATATCSARSTRA